MIWEYAVLLNPTEERRKAGDKPELVVPITTCIAKSDKEATMIAIRAVPPAFAELTDRLEVAVRPF